MVLTSNTVIFLCTLESPWTEHSPTSNTLKKWKEKWEQGTTSSINSQTHHGVPILPPCELLPLHSAIQLQNMPVLCGKDHPMQRKLTPPLSSCRCITGCLRPTNVDSLYVLAGIAPPGVCRSVASRTERRRQADDTRHPCHNHQPAPSRLKPRKSFLHAVQPLSQPPQTTRLTLWEEQRIAKQHLAKLPIPTSEQLAPGHKSEWKLWKSLNRLRTGIWAAAKPTWVNGAMLIQQIQPVNAGPQSRPCSTCWDAHFLKMNAAWKICQLPNIWLNSEMMDTRKKKTAPVECEAMAH